MIHTVLRRTLFSFSLALFLLAPAVHAQDAKLVADDGAERDNFGEAVALSADGSVALVGASSVTVGENSSQGSAYVFTSDGAGNWVQQAKLTADDGAERDFFGGSVALSADGSTALIGANDDDVGDNNDQGSAYVFTDDGSGNWTQQAKLTASDGGTSDNFGGSVALSADGSTALIGADRDFINGTFGQGSAYVFTNDGSGNWTQQAKITASDGGDSDFFGNTVALNADGSRGFITAAGGNVNQGAGIVYVFEKDDAENWTQQDQLAASDGESNDSFGSSLAVSNDGSVTLIGAFSDTIGAFDDAGSAYVFVRSDSGTWTQQAKLTSTRGTGEKSLGTSVALSADGSEALLGADSDDHRDSLYGDHGSAFTFSRNDAGDWIEQRRLTASDGAAGDRLGISSALSADGSVALLGAFSDDIGESSTDQGSAYIFALPVVRSTTAVSSNGSVDFEATGVDIDFSGVSGSDTVTVERFDAGPSETAGISEENVSDYRFVLRAGGELSFDASTEVRFDVSTLGGINDPSDVTVYTRSTPGEASFTAPSTSYDADANEFVVTTGSFGEFVFASDTNPLPTEGLSEVPQQFALEGNAPNPFAGETTIRYALPKAAPVTLTVYDVLGRKVTTLVDRKQAAGRQQVRFEAEGLPAGVYVYRLQAGEVAETRQMVVVE